MPNKQLNLDNYATVGDYIRSHRLALGISQKYLIEQAASSRPTINAIEHNRNPDTSFALVLKVLQILRKHGAPPIDLYRLALK